MYLRQRQNYNFNTECSLFKILKLLQENFYYCVSACGIVVTENSVKQLIVIYYTIR